MRDPAITCTLVDQDSGCQMVSPDSEVLKPECCGVNTRAAQWSPCFLYCEGISKHGTKHTWKMGHRHPRGRISTTYVEKWQKMQIHFYVPKKNSGSQEVNIWGLCDLLSSGGQQACLIPLDSGLEGNINPGGPDLLIGPWEIWMWFLRIQFLTLFYWLLSSDLLLIMILDECQGTLLMISQ